MIVPQPTPCQIPEPIYKVRNHWLSEKKLMGLPPKAVMIWLNRPPLTEQKSFSIPTIITVDRK